MTTTAIVLGSTGMLGQAMLAVLSRREELRVFGTYRSESLAGPLKEHNLISFDAKSGATGLRKLLDQAGGEPACFINCIALLKSEVHESKLGSVVQAQFLNAEFPRQLAAFVGEAGCRMVHISTDGVFSGRNAALLNENTVPDPDDAYGRTKLAGEPSSHASITIRTSIIGRDPLRHKGLLEWFIAQPDGAELRGYRDAIWAGVTTVQLAELCGKLLEGDNFSRAREESAVHHFSPNAPVSKYELLEIFKRALSKRVTIVPTNSPSGPSRRVLETRFATSPRLFGTGLSIEQAVAQLSAH